MTLRGAAIRAPARDTIRAGATRKLRGADSTNHGHALPVDGEVSVRAVVPKLWTVPSSGLEAVRASAREA